MHAVQIVAALFAVLVAAWIALLCRTERLVRTAGVRLADLPCPQCGFVMGAEAAAAAVAAREAQLRKLHEFAREKGVVLRIPDWRFACANCGALLTFDPGTTRRPLTLAEEQPPLDPRGAAPT